MKAFKEYLTESKKTYKFKVRVAGDLPENFADKLDRSLTKFEVISVSTGKKTPITEKISKEIVTIPIHPNLKKSEINRIVKTINSII